MLVLGKLSFLIGRCPMQRDLIGRFIALWATFLSLWQQLFCPNFHIFRQFVKGVQLLIFLVNLHWRNPYNSEKDVLRKRRTVLGHFYRHLATFLLSRWSHVQTRVWRQLDQTLFIFNFLFSFPFQWQIQKTESISNQINQTNGLSPWQNK